MPLPLVAQEPACKWYALQTFSGYEKKVKEFIETVLEREGLRKQLQEILIPTQNVFVMRAGKKRTQEKTDFPGYMLVNIILDTRMRYVFKEQVFKVKKEAIKWLPNRDNPEPLHHMEVQRILGRIDDARESGDKPELPYEIGDRVRVIDGPFKEFAGHVDEILPDKLKVRVMVSIFGRKTPVELDYLQVEAEE
ncbi:MAG: transcription termination/antitermination protein NusG [Bacteroidota bacterium]|nr:transcription termination/antitermination protein NusG [Bacteroidota bacterium]MDE2834869.1 transcription termination/antitermination protein NusG [Bacteroidota bacterium]MDE2957320.1 transcription termination/antitermination protein NusG [Bacteroidota bacterium]